MATTIAILTFSAAMILVTAYLSIQHSRRSEATTEQVTKMLTQTMNMVSSDMADLVKTTQTNMENLVLGRDSTTQLPSPPNSTNVQPIPGLETLEGLPPNVTAAILRDEATPTHKEWQTVSGTPVPPYDPNLATTNGHLQTELRDWLDSTSEKE